MHAARVRTTAARQPRPERDLHHQSRSDTATRWSDPADAVTPVGKRRQWLGRSPVPPSRPRLRRIVSGALAMLGVATTLLAATPAEAAKRMRGDRRVGIGGGLGDPTGPSLKFFLAPQHALQLDFGWAPMHHGNGILHLNYLFH